ncbi:MAG: hypothetical protein C7B45_04010 [Sulfobacillus acidophilus]|uniref:HTH merR-type domain-containing protein n=1 Tax=Sulfobacillus acidophilus TaxID=53633 RepID=A0A2T2WLJ9_9FIRM|nr:MAG: hypothetical protein C7B45_04010 [Sulfobacillus acidophilus]
MGINLVGIREAIDLLGVTLPTLRRWEREGKRLPDERTTGGYRRDDPARLRREQVHCPDSDRRTVVYARVSSHDQKDGIRAAKRVLPVDTKCPRRRSPCESGRALTVVRSMIAMSTWRSIYARWPRVRWSAVHPCLPNGRYAR